MSSFPDHEDNLETIKQLNLDIDSIDLDDDPYDSWDYDTLTYLVTELLEIIKTHEELDNGG